MRYSVGMNDSARQPEYHLEPELVPSSPDVYKNIGRLFSDVSVGRSYTSLVMDFHTYVEQEYGLDDKNGSELFESGRHDAFFPSEELFDANPRAAKDLFIIFMYENLAKTYEDAHSVRESTVWMQHFFAKVKADVKGRHAATDCKQPPREVYRQCDNAPCPVNYIKSDLAREASAFIDICTQDSGVLVDEAYIKIVRRLQLAHVSNILDDSDYSRALTDINLQFDSIAQFAKNAAIMTWRIPKWQNITVDSE